MLRLLSTLPLHPSPEAREIGLMAAASSEFAERAARRLLAQIESEGKEVRTALQAAARTPAIDLQESSR